MECPRFSKETLKRLGWSHSGSESGWYFWELLQVALRVYVYAGHSGPACWFAANLTSFEMQFPLYAIPFYSSKDYSKSCNVLFIYTGRGLARLALIHLGDHANSFHVVTRGLTLHCTAHTFNIDRTVCGTFGEIARQLSPTQCTDALSLS